MDQGASNGKASPDFADADERIFALLSVVEDQQTAVRAGIQGMAQERAALATERVALVQQAEQMKRLTDKLSSMILATLPKVAEAASQAAGLAVKRALAETAMTAVNAAEIAAKPTLDGVTAAVKSAAAVQLELKKAVKDFRREWLLVVACLLATAIIAASLMSYLAIWIQRQDLQQLEAQKDKLTAEVNALQEQAAQGKRNNGRKLTGK